MPEIEIVLAILYGIALVISILGNIYLGYIFNVNGGKKK